MLDTRYLQYGLDAISRAHQTNYFTDGHRGAAIIAAYFFCQEYEVEQGVPNILRSLIDEQWVDTPLCEPFPREKRYVTGVERILEALEQSMDYLRQVGHNVIFPTMALKAFQQLPEMVTPSRVRGICKLIEAFTASEPFVLDQDDAGVDFISAEATAEFILAELLRTIVAFEGRGQGWSGHLLTYGRALLDLRELGYIKAAKLGEYGFNLYIQRLRMGPLESDKPRPEHAPSLLRPHQQDYWEGRRGQSLSLGHSIKYPYGFFGLQALTKNKVLVQQCFDRAYHIF